MPFQPGNILAKTRQNKRGGRPTKERQELEETAQEMARKMLEKHGKPIMSCWVALASSGEDPATTRHAVDKLLPDDQFLTNGQTLNIFIAQAIKTTEPGSSPELRGNGIQVRIGGNNGQNGNGSDGA